MSEQVYAEVKRLIDDAYAEARRIIEANRTMLDQLATALLERETLDREDLDLLARGEPLPPRAAPQPAPSFAPKPGPAPSPRPPLMGMPPAEQPSGA